MSYIGKNPKVDSVKLEGSATAASGTDEGQLYYNTGTGSISKGLKVYKNGQFVAIDKQLGDADTFHLLKAADISTAEWDAARNSTSTSYLNQNSVPFETSTASGVAGTFNNSSTGDALLTDESADLVFAYKSSGSSDDAQEYFGIPLSIPKAFRGENVVLSFQYRTGYGTGTTATVDGDFEVSILDKSSGNGGQTTSTNSTTDITAGSAITVASKTGLAVGQRIRLEAGSQSTIGNPDATVVEAYITEVSSTANEIKISEDWDTPHASGAVVVSGWLTDVVSGRLPAADSQTDKQGKKFSIQFKTEDDTSDIVLFFQNKNTSSTISRHLFIDNILLSANKFLQASSQTKSEVYVVQGGQVAANGDSTNTTAGYYFGSTNTPNLNTIDKLGTVINDNATGFKFTANQDLMISAHFSGAKSTDGWLNICSGPDSALTNADAGGSAFDLYRRGGVVVSANDPKGVSANFKLPKGEVFRFYSTNTAAAYTGTIVTMGFTATPMVSDVILLENQDEIFTDWQEYTPTYAGLGTVTTRKAVWRRNGSNMELLVQFTTGTVAASDAYFELPSGYFLDQSQLETTNNDFAMVGKWTADNASAYDGFLMINANSSNSSRIFFTVTSGSYNPFDSRNGNQILASSRKVTARATVPIQGFNSNFNPLLSMPLVDIGNDIEEYSLYGWTGNAGTRSLYSTNTPNINTIDKLGTISTMSSTVAWSFTASQRVKVNISAEYGQSTTGNWFSIAAGPSTIVGDQDLAFDHASMLPYNKSVSRTAGANHAETTSASFIMEPNEVCMIHLNASGNVATSGYQGGVWMTAERVKGPNNMAHIIKPAVAYLYDQKTSTTAGGTAATAGFYTRTLNTMKGETWFVTLNSTNNGFTLDPGQYDIEFSSPAYQLNNNQARLYDTTNSVVVQNGTNSYANSTYNGASVSSGKAMVTIGSATEYKIELYAGSGSTSGGGLGVDVAGATYSIYTTVKISKLK